MFKDFFKVILEKLTSRKLWIAIAGCVYFALQGDMDKVVDIAKTYILVEGGVNVFGGVFPPTKK